MSGTISKLPSGRFRLRMSVSGRQQTIGTFATREEAEHEAEATAIVLDQTRADYEGLTISVFGRGVIAARETGKKVRDSRSEWSRFDHHIKRDDVGRIALRKLNQTHVHEWVARLEKKKLAPQTVRNCLNLLRVILTEAAKRGKARSNVAHGVRVAGSRKAWTYATPEEQLRILAAAPEVERHILSVQMGAGMRPGELCAMHLEDVHADGDEPHLYVQYGKPHRRPPKTETGIRKVPLFGLALVAVRSWLKLLPSYCPNNRHGLLFPTQTGAYRDPAHVIDWEVWRGAPDPKGGDGARFVGILELAGITRRFRFYDLRHTCASSLVSGWWGRRWGLHEVKELLGHTSIKTTMIYAHLAESALAEAGRETAKAVDTTRHEALLFGPPEGHGKHAESRHIVPVAPPGRVELPANGLGIRSVRTNSAGKQANVYGVSSVSGDVVSAPQTESDPGCTPPARVLPLAPQQGGQLRHFDQDVGDPTGRTGLRTPVRVCNRAPRRGPDERGNSSQKKGTSGEASEAMSEGAVDPCEGMRGARGPGTHRPPGRAPLKETDDAIGPERLRHRLGPHAQDSRGPAARSVGLVSRDEVQAGSDATTNSCERGVLRSASPRSAGAGREPPHVPGRRASEVGDVADHVRAPRVPRPFLLDRAVANLACLLAGVR